MYEDSSSKIRGEQSYPYVDKTGLPRNYGDTKIIILPRDPMWMFAYWEVSPGTFSELKKKLGEQSYNSSKWTLRIYDVTGVTFNGSNQHKYFDISIDYWAENWYINVREANRAWCVDIGIVTPDGKFITVARSNVIIMPRQGISPITDEQWAMLQQEFERLLRLSGVDRIGKSSFDIAKLMRERWEEIVSISLPGSPMGASSWRKMNVPEEVKGFWLRADTELIVYGATESNAKLTVQGKAVRLNPDGSFSLRFYLPDGKQEYPIEAVSADGKMKRQITFQVERKAR